MSVLLGDFLGRFIFSLGRPVIWRGVVAVFVSSSPELIATNTIRAKVANIFGRVIIYYFHLNYQYPNDFL